jgi:uncharacterized delta-60 repeat protein
MPLGFLLSIFAIVCASAVPSACAQFESRFFEKPGFTRQVLQRPDGKIWVVYEEPQAGRDTINEFDVPRLFRSALLDQNGQHIRGSDRLIGTGNRFTFGFFGVAAQPDQKLLLGTEMGGFFRLNADGSRDATFNPDVSQQVSDVLVQTDGKIVVSPELIRLNPDGGKDASFNASLADEYPGQIEFQSSGKIVVTLGVAPYLKRLNTDGSTDATFTANLPDFVYSLLVLPGDPILVRLGHLNPDNSTTFTWQRLDANGVPEPAFHPDSRVDMAYAAQPDGKILAGFRDPGTGDYFLGRMNQDGSLDSSYQIYPAPQLENTGTPIAAVFIQTDGSILASIVSATEGEQFLRFNSSGVLDAASKTAFTVPGAPTRLSPQPDGKLLVAGDFNFVDHAKTGALVRLDRDGNLDPQFHPPAFSVRTSAIDLARQGTGSVLFSLSRSDTTGTSRMRLTEDGSVDSSFAEQNLGMRFAIRGDDKIVTDSGGNIVSRLLSDGTIDPAFSPTSVTFGGNLGNAVVDFAIAPDGSTVVVGNGTFFGGIHSMPVRAGVLRIKPDGGLDNAFNPPIFGNGTRFNCVAVQPDGKILLGGRFTINNVSGLANLVRLNPDGSIDNSFLAVPDSTVSAIRVEQTGTILIGGGFSHVNGAPTTQVARLSKNGTLQPEFSLDTGGAAVNALTILADGRIVAGGDFGLVVGPSARLSNLSTRTFVDAGDNALIAGIIITGTAEKRVLIRGLGPSLKAIGIADALEDPNLELRDADGGLVASNDDWGQSTNKQAIIDTTIPPSDPKEAAIVAMLPAGGATYTTIMRPARDNSGIGLVEVYDLDPATSSSALANMSSRGNVFTGDRAMISGLIVTGSGAAGSSALMRGLGPELPLSGALHDTTLELHYGSSTIGFNDDWKQTQRGEIEATSIPPRDDRESAILEPLIPGTYTAILRGKGNETGIGLLEIYNLAP